MRLPHILPLAAALALMAGAAAADTPPPEGALPLSQVIAALEAADEVHWIDEVEWDDDGYWEVEYYTRDGRKVEVRLDPMTGEPRR